MPHHLRRHHVGHGVVHAHGAKRPRTPPTAASPNDPVWLKEARSKYGLSERANNAELRKFLASDGSTVGNPAKVPWCGDFLQTCIKLTLPHEPMPENPFYALNWVHFGQPLKAGTTGAILVFHRPGGGHVGLYVGERKDAYRVLGGNTANRVSETWIAKSRCRGIRWPKTASLPTTGAVHSTAGGKLSTNEA